MRRIAIYFDTSYWNHLANGDWRPVRDVLIENHALICYSQDSLLELLSTRDEARRAVLESLLDNLQTRYISYFGDPTQGPPSDFTLDEVDREGRLKIYSDATDFPSVGGVGFLDILQKFIGGIESKAYVDILSEANGKIISLLDEAIDDLDDGPLKDAHRLWRASFLNGLEAASQELLLQLEKNTGARLPELDHVKVANFSGPGTVEKLMKVAENSHAFHVASEYLEDIPKSRDEARKLEPTRERVLRLAQVLFLLRYKREAKNMKDGERARLDFQGSWTDLEHIAHASCYTAFQTADKAQAQIAAAVYDHLNVSSSVFHFSIKHSTSTAIYEPTETKYLIEL